MGEEINTIIDNLCAKFGTTLQNLVPEMARMSIAEEIAVIIISIIIIVIMYKLSMKIWKRSIEMSDPDEAIPLIFTITGGVVFTGILSFSIISLIGWIASPTAKTIEMIMGMIK